MCIAAGLTEKYPNNIYLLYLCQDISMKRKGRDFAQPTRKKRVKVFARTVDEIDGLNANKWWYN
jgi:hypothetical protein